MPLECLYYLVLVDRPIQHHMVFLCGNYDGVVVVSMRELLDLVVLHEELSVALSIGCEINIQCLTVRNV